ncbi:MAG: ATP:cob(I)alamin adenosyltransferase [Thermaerobacter sp.]|nr:ATP:cob(I)alamin adenosyltransferase [Thermaerobacter sp.]
MNRRDSKARGADALRAVDELNAMLGLLRGTLAPSWEDWLIAVQHQLFAVGANLARYARAAGTEGELPLLPALPSDGADSATDDSPAGVLMNWARSVAWRTWRRVAALETAEAPAQYLQCLVSSLAAAEASLKTGTVQIGPERGGTGFDSERKPEKGSSES